jgi:signal transduction histidine kinase
LDVSQFANGQLRLNWEEVNIVETVKDVVVLIKFQAKAKNIEFKFKNFIDFSLMILSDSNRLKQILFNLLGNALKFTKNGHIHVILEIKKKFEQN